MWELNPDEWDTPALHYERRRVGNWRIRTLMQSPAVYQMWGIDRKLYYHHERPLKVTLLQELRNGKWATWMVDDVPHWRSMQIYAQGSKGKVLAAGLGLGLIAHAVEPVDSVESITIVERSMDVIDLVGPHVKPLQKTRIVSADWYSFMANEARIAEYDTVIVDLWVTHSVEEKLRIYYQEILPMMMKLKQAKPGMIVVFHGWVGQSGIKIADAEMSRKVIEAERLMQRFERECSTG